MEPIIFNFLVVGAVLLIGYVISAVLGIAINTRSLIIGACFALIVLYFLNR